MDAVTSHPWQHDGISTEPFVAADVGGTHARVALVGASSGGDDGIEVLAYRSFACHDYPALSELLRSFVDACAVSPVRRCVLACAGQVMGDRVIHDNLAWPIGLARLRAALRLDDVTVLNDFEALAYTLDDPAGAAGQWLCGPDVRVRGPILVVGPGTGLGAAVRFPGGIRGSVLTTEAGQMDFAVQTVREREVLASMAPNGGYVPYERVLSGPGLLTLYVTVCNLSGRPPTLVTPEEVTVAARAQSDPQAVEAVELFCAVLGSFAGDLAMVFMASGGVYLAGGFLSSIVDLLQRSRFAERFVHERSVREFLERVPVRVIEHGRRGVLGAATWYADKLVRGRVPRGRVAEHGLAG